MATAAEKGQTTMARETPKQFHLRDIDGLNDAQEYVFNKQVAGMLDGKTADGTILWEQRPLKLYFINVSYWLVSFMIMALILVLGSQAIVASSYDTQNMTGQYLGE